MTALVTMLLLPFILVYVANSFHGKVVYVDRIVEKEVEKVVEKPISTLDKDDRRDIIKAMRDLGVRKSHVDALIDSALEQGITEVEEVFQFCLKNMR